MDYNIFNFLKEENNSYKNDTSTKELEINEDTNFYIKLFINYYNKGC